ncbi:MAG: hypothetical protein V3W31_07945 [Thermodesulfobacteriota bacterium]
MGEEKKSHDFMLGEIWERTKHIPEIRKDMACLKRKVAVIEVKSGLWGTLGGFLAMAGLYVKELFGGR